MKNYFHSGALILRVLLGITFFAHGVDKYQAGIGNIAGWFESIGIPGFMAYVVASIELIGGIALILGFGTRIVSALLAIILLVATFKVKLAVGFFGNGQMAGYELDLSMMGIAIYLLLNGSNLLSIDSLFKKGQKTA
ncbi:DoxX family protein [Cohnella luojiensis]|uniref:DoxX family protein n=1 Tax=Cohnella luojiensis TaxID=652876 RepID=UPI001F0DB58B|nr:DoxX family protein [Cohnella luojiensis]